MKFTLAAITVLALVASAAAECPNACSGHGECSQNDMCTCYRNWQANDCSERVCPYGIAFTTTPQGDLNSDGDLYDSSKKLIVIKSGSSAGDAILASITTLTNTLTFQSDLAAGELNVGDCLSIENNRRCVTALSSTNPLKVFTLDADIDTTINYKPVYKFLENIARPGGTWEAWPGDAAATMDDEGHFYMECSNQGLCDRSTGTCECFDGFSGRGCSRSSCPSDCSGHGVCLTVAELAVRNPTKLAVTGEVSRKGTFVTTSTSAAGILSAGDRVYLGEQTQYEASNLYTVGTVSASGFTISPEADVPLSFGSVIYHAPTYNLWDANKNQACKCDAGYTGYDCASRVCPSGADPLDMVGEDMKTSVSSTSVSSTYTKTTETQLLSLDSSCGTVDGSFTLGHTDAVYGYKRSTNAISVEPELSSTVSVGVPPAVDATYCQYDSTTYAAGSAGGQCFSYVAFTPHLPVSELSVGDFIRVGSQYRKVGACTTDTTSGNYSSCYVTNSFDNQYASGTYAFAGNTKSNIQNELKNMPNDLFPSTVSATKVFSGTQLSVQAMAYSSGAITFRDYSAAAATLPSSEICTGDRIKDDGWSVGTAGTQGMLVQVNDFQTKSSTATKQVEGEIVNIQTDSGELVLSAAAGENFESHPTSPAIHDGQFLLYRDSGARYEIATGLSGNPSELTCDSSGLRSVYHSAKSGYVTRAEPFKVYFVDTTYGSNQPAYSPLVNGDLGDGHREALSVGDVIYVGTQKCTIASVDGSNSQTASTGVAAVITGGSMESGRAGASRSNNANVGFVTCREKLQESSHSTADELETHAHVSIAVGGATVRCGATDMKPLEWKKLSSNNFQRSASTGTYGACLEGSGHNCVNVRSRSGTTDCSDSTGVYTDCRKVSAGAQDEAGAVTLRDRTLSVGDRVTLEASQEGLFETRKIDFISSDWSYFTVSKAFSKGYTGSRMFVNKQGTKSLTECSGRGLCMSDTGDCECFKGYHDNACSSQSALAA